MENVFRLQIKLGNDAMQTTEDIAEALRQLTEKPNRIISHSIRDINGNKVGECGIS